MKIPKIIHQLWIGPKTVPTKFMDTWKEKHENEGFEYIRWTEKEMEKRGFKTKLKNKIDDIEEICGKADILRWEILYEYGGFFTDADSYCIEPVTYLLDKYKAFVCYENEKVRNKGWIKSQDYDDVLARTHPLLANGTMAFPPKHKLPKMAIEWIKNNNIEGLTAWRTTGPGLLTRLYWLNKWKDIEILPSYLFLPVHFSGVEYKGHNKIYAHQEWGSTKQNYENMNNISLPTQFTTPKKKVSVLIPFYNTKVKYLIECLNSIKHQVGHFSMEIVLINDGSDDLHTILLKKIIQNFQDTTRFIKVIYIENDENKGVGFTLSKGISVCNNELIIRMDADDIMVPDRIIKQIKFMNNNPDIMICGGQIKYLKNEKITGQTNHKSLTWEDYKKNPSHWFINHPTVCYRKSAVLQVGNYKDIKQIEDFELWLRMLKKFGKIYNFPEVLLYYRLHEEQETHNGGKNGHIFWNNIRNDIIKTQINN